MLGTVKLFAILAGPAGQPLADVTGRRIIFFRLPGPPPWFAVVVGRVVTQSVSTDSVGPQVPDRDTAVALTAIHLAMSGAEKSAAGIAAINGFLTADVAGHGFSLWLAATRQRSAATAGVSRTSHVSLILRTSPSRNVWARGSMVGSLSGRLVSPISKTKRNSPMRISSPECSTAWLTTRLPLT